MIHELRSYRLVPAHMQEFLALTRDVGMPIRLKHSTLLGYWTVDVGALNEVTSLWEYDDFRYRARVRAALAADPAWNRDFVARTRPFSLGETSPILVPSPAVPFAPETGHGVYELRTYRLHPGKTAEWVEIFARGLDARRRYSAPIGLWTAELGDLNHVHHLWGYEDLQARAEIRRAASADAEWTRAVAALAALTQWQRTRVLVPTPWSPLR